MIKMRIPQSVKDSRDLQEMEGRFVEGVEKDNLSVLTLDQLADRFESIENQAQLFQGRILLEARNRFESDKLFGQWVTETLCSGSVTTQHRTRLMNLARFFDDKPLDKISVTAAYEISAPVNADIAVDVYEYAKGKKLSVSEIKRQIAIRKGESLPLPELKPSNTGELKTDSLIESTNAKQPVEKTAENKHIEAPEKSKVEIIMTEVLADMSKEEKSAILRECLRDINLYPAR